MPDKIIVFGQVLRKLTNQRVPVHYVYEIEDGKAMVQSGQEMISIKESYATIANWRKQINIQVTEE